MDLVFVFAILLLYRPNLRATFIGHAKDSHPLRSVKLPIKPKCKGGDSDEPVQGPVDHWNYGKGNMNAGRKRILPQRNELVGQDVRNR